MHRLAVGDVAQAVHAGSAQREGGVVAARAGEEELGGVKVGQHEIVGVGRLVRVRGARLSIGLDVERQQHRHRAFGDAGEARGRRGVEWGEGLDRRGGNTCVARGRLPVDAQSGQQRVHHPARRRH